MVNEDLLTLETSLNQQIITSKWSKVPLFIFNTTNPPFQIKIHEFPLQNHQILSYTTKLKH